MLQKKLVYVIFFTFGMRCCCVGYMVTVPLVCSSGG